MLSGFSAILAGWLAGMLVNYLADVLPLQRRLVRPFCLDCRAPAPSLLHYFLWPRRCPFCGRARRARNGWVEIIFILLSGWLWYTPPERLGFALSLALLTYFGLVIVIDIEYHLILHPVSLVGMLLGLGVGLWLHGPRATLLGGLAGFGVMLSLYLLGLLFMRLYNRRQAQPLEDEALGFGDVNLSGVIGLLLGWPGIVAGLFLAIMLAGLVSLFYIGLMLALRRYRPSLALPYGPFLAGSALFLLVFRGML